jgi:hypothetical protein
MIASTRVMKTIANWSNVLPGKELAKMENVWTILNFVMARRIVSMDLMNKIVQQRQLVTITIRVIQGNLRNYKL